MNILIDSKFDEIKNVFAHETKGLFIKEMKDEMKKLFAEEFEKIKTETNKKIFNFSEQYGWCLCLRIINKKNKRRCKWCIQVCDIFKEAEAEIPKAVLDRAHRIRKENNDVIVCFTTFRHHCSNITIKNLKN